MPPVSKELKAFRKEVDKPTHSTKAETREALRSLLPSVQIVEEQFARYRRLLTAVEYAEDDPSLKSMARQGQQHLGAVMREIDKLEKAAASLDTAFDSFSTWLHGAPGGEDVGFLVLANQVEAKP